MASEATWRMRAAIALVAVIVAAAVAGLALALGGPGTEPPATGAAAMVPGDALVYIHLSTDSHRPAVRDALSTGRRFPDFPLAGAALTSRLDAIAAGGRPVDFQRDIRPWLGKEAALALLDTATSTAGSLIVLDVSDRSRAQRFIDDAGAAQVAIYRHTRLYGYRRGAELAFSGHYLLLGQDASVRAGLDAAAGAVPSLARTAAYERAAAGEPADRFLDAYASAAGVRRVLGSRGGALGALGVLLYQPALSGVTASISAGGATARIRVHTVLDPALARTAPKARSFSPSLAGEAPSGSMLLLDAAGLDRLAPRVLSAAAAGGIAGQVGPLLSRLGAALGAEGVNVQQITSLFSGESAVAVTPTAHAPALVIVTRTRDETRAKSELAALEVPLAQLFPAPASGSGQVPQFNDHTIDGVTAHQLALSPGLQIAYAVFDNLIVVSTSLDGIAGVIAHDHALTGDSGYHLVLGSHPEQVTSLLFLDLSQLLSLGEQTGLARSTRYRGLRPDLDKVRAVGLSSTSGGTDSTAELTLQIS